MSTISLCMIVKNEEEVLARCLDCVKDIVDEIIIVDTGSKDRTKQIAEKYTNKIYNFEWIDDFAAARNFAFSKGTSDWLMWLDADDIIEEDSRKALVSLKKRLDFIKENYIVTKYDISFDKNGNLELSSLRERIARKTANPLWIGKVHETIENSADNSIFISDFIITHKKINQESILNERNLNIYKKMIEENIELDSRHLYHLGVEYLNINYYLEAIKYFNQAIDKGLTKWLYLQSIIYISECYIQTQQYEKSLEYLFDYLKKYPPNKGIALKILKTYWEQTQAEAALKWGQMCLAIEDKNSSNVFIDNREDALTHQYLTTIYYVIRDYEKAFEHNKILKERFPNEECLSENEEKILEKMNFKEGKVLTL